MAPPVPVAPYAEQVHRLLADSVADGAALGWLCAPALPEVCALLDDLDAASGAGDAAVVVERDGDQVVAFGYWRRYGRPTLAPQADVERVVVADGWRGRGLGRSLVRRLVQSARVVGVEVLTLDARGDNAAALALYRSEGFQEHGRLPGFVAVGEARYDQVLMSRRLAAPTTATEPAPELFDHLVGWLLAQRADGRVLLARRSGVSYADGLWGPPGGHVDDDESLAQGAAREAVEEVGLTVEAADLKPLGVTRYVDGPHRGCDFFFLAHTWSGEPTPVSECSEVGWFALDELPDDVLPWLPGALQAHLVDGVGIVDAPASPSG